MKDHDFEENLNEVEVAAWKTFKKVVTEFLGNRKARNYGELVLEILQNYKVLGCSKYLKIHFLDSHLDFFPENFNVVSDEYQDISTMEKHYQENVIQICFYTIVGY